LKELSFFFKNWQSKNVLNNSANVEPIVPILVLNCQKCLSSSDLALWFFPIFSTIINSTQNVRKSGTPSAGNPFLDPKIQRILKIYKGKYFPTAFYFFYLKKKISQNWITWCICCGPDASVDPRMDDIDSCHILMSYDKKCHIMANNA
jgi:hypothetical protein